MLKLTLLAKYLNQPKDQAQNREITLKNQFKDMVLVLLMNDNRLKCLFHFAHVFAWILGLEMSCKG